jgi:hypothetical protein
VLLPPFAAPAVTAAPPALTPAVLVPALPVLVPALAPAVLKLPALLTLPAVPTLPAALLAVPAASLPPGLGVSSPQPMAATKANPDKQQTLAKLAAEPE